MGSEVFALTSLPGGFSLMAPSCRRQLYRSDPLFAAVTQGSYGPALRRLYVGADVRSCKARAANGSGGSGTSIPKALQDMKRGEE
jgi:hypothetical protein